MTDERQRMVEEERRRAYETIARVDRALRGRDEPPPPAPQAKEPDAVDAWISSMPRAGDGPAAWLAWQRAEPREWTSPPPAPTPPVKEKRGMLTDAMISRMVDERIAAAIERHSKIMDEAVGQALGAFVDEALGSLAEEIGATTGRLERELRELRAEVAKANNKSEVVDLPKIARRKDAA